MFAGETEERSSVTEDTAQKLVEAAAAGDDRATDALLEAQRPWLGRFCLKRARTREDAEDLEQEILVSACAGLEKFRQQCPFSLWLLNIAKNRLTNYYERVIPGYGRSTSLETIRECDLWEVQQTQDPPCPERLVEENWFAEQLRNEARKACHGDQFRVVLLRLQDESPKEIADLLQMNEATVRSHWLRGRRRLQAHLLRHRPDLLDWLVAALIVLFVSGGMLHGS